MIAVALSLLMTPPTMDDVRAEIAAAQPAGENAVPVLVECGERFAAIRDAVMAKFEGQPEFISPVVPPFWARSDVERRAGREVMHGCAEAGLYDAIDAAVRMPTAIWPDAQPLDGALELRYVARLGSARLYDALVADDADAAVVALEHVLGSARVAAWSPNLGVRGSVANGCEWMAWTALGAFMFERGGCSREMASALLDVLDRHECAPLRFTMRGAWAFDRETLHRTDPPPDNVASWSDFIIDEDDQRTMTDAEILAALDTFWSEWSQMADRPRWKRRPTARPITLNSPAKTIDALDQGTAQARGVKIMLLLELHRHDHGDYPETLASLDFGRAGVPVHAATNLPIDPWTGETYGYGLLNDDHHGRPYLLYLAGRDGVDNGGKNHRSFDRAWKQNGAGYDVIINRSQELDLSELERTP